METNKLTRLKTRLAPKVPECCKDKQDCRNFAGCGGIGCPLPCPKCLFWEGYGCKEKCVKDLVGRLENLAEKGLINNP